MLKKNIQKQKQCESDVSVRDNNYLTKQYQRIATTSNIPIDQVGRYLNDEL